MQKTTRKAMQFNSHIRKIKAPRAALPGAFCVYHTH